MFKDEKGMNTVEIVIILAILVSIALIFRTSVFGFVKNNINRVFTDENVKQMEDNIIPEIEDNV